MPSPKPIKLSRFRDIADKISKLPETVPSLGLADLIAELAPQITEARNKGVPAKRIYDVVARDARCSADMVQRYYRRAIQSGFAEDVDKDRGPMRPIKPRKKKG